MTDLIKQEPAAVPQTVSEQSTSLMKLIDMAIQNKDVDVEKLNGLLDAQERVLDRRAAMDFNADMAKLRKELTLTPVVKNKLNGQTSSSYADLESIKSIVSPLLDKYNFFDRYENDYPSDDIVGTTCEIVHISGHSMKNRVQVHFDDKGIKGSVNKTKPHAAASSMTYGERLALCKALGIKTSKDDDGNQYINHELDDVQFTAISDLIEETKTDKEAFARFMKAPSIRQIKQKDYLKAMNSLNTKKAKIAEENNA